MKYPKKFIKFVGNIISHGMKYMRLNSFTVNIQYMDGPSAEYPEAAAQTITDINYKRITVVVFPLMLKAWKEDPEQAIDYLLHECVHPLTEPLHSMVINPFKTQGELTEKNEGLVQDITTIIGPSFRKFLNS